MYSVLVCVCVCASASLHQTMDILLYVPYTDIVRNNTSFLGFGSSFRTHDLTNMSHLLTSCEIRFFFNCDVCRIERLGSALLVRTFLHVFLALPPCWLCLAKARRVLWLHHNCAELCESSGTPNACAWHPATGLTDTLLAQVGVTIQCKTRRKADQR